MSARRVIQHCCATRRGTTSVSDLRPEPPTARLVPAIMLALRIALMYKSPQGKLMHFLLACNDAVHVGPKLFCEFLTYVRLD